MIKKKKKTRNTRKKVKLKVIGIIVILLLIIGSILAGIYLKYDSYYLKYLEDDKISYKIISKSIEKLERNIDIKQVEYNWSTDMPKNNEPNKIIVHHTAADNLTPEQIHNDHVKKDFDGIGYHYYIRKDGTVYKGRPDNVEGAHTIGENKTSIGICLEGNFEKQKPSEKQSKALEDLCEYLIVKYNLETIIGHRDAYNTLCPGKNLSVDKLNENISNQLINLSHEDK